MKNLCTWILFVLFGILISCEKQEIIKDPPLGEAITPKPIDWLFTSSSVVRDSGYYSIQPYNGPELWQYTRITQMDIAGLVMIDNQPVKFSGQLYLRQIAGNKPVSDGYLRLCEARDDNTSHCLEFVVIHKTPGTEIKSLSDLKLAQTFSFGLRVDNLSGRYNRAENNSRELDLKLKADPQTASYSLILNGGLVY